MLEVACPLFEEFGRNTFRSHSEKVLDLCREDRYGDTAGKSDNDRIGDEFDDGSQLEQAQQNEQYTGHDRCDDQTFFSVLGDDPVDDYDKSAGRSADLYLAAPQQRNDKNRQ